MKIEDLLDQMSKTYLERIVKSFTTELYRKDEDGYKEQIKGNIDHLNKTSTVRESINSHLKESKNTYQDGLLVTFILRTLLRSNDFLATEEEIITNVKNLEEDVIKKSKSKENFKHIEEHSYEIMKVILEAALDDNNISEDELHLIKKVRKKLSVHENDQFMIQAQLNHFPQEGNQIHQLDDVKQALVDLQKCGVIFYCNKLKGQPFIIPEEIIDAVKQYLDIELIETKFDDFLDILTSSELKQILNQLNLKQSGKKEELISRIMITGIKPSEILDSLSNARLNEICKDLPDVKSSGTKEERIHRIIDHFDRLVGIEAVDSSDEREKYYLFYEQLAKIDLANLLGKKIVKHQRDIELAFERATHYLFETKLLHNPVKQNGSEHCDGCLNFGNNGELMMWDNKALLAGNKYEFPNGHFKQFKRYIRDASVNGKRVNCFMVVVPEINEDAAKLNAAKLKYESGTDTDVSIITATNLKWIAEEWSSKNKDKPINLEIFNMTGILTREELKMKLKMFS